jgi:hypothetical protein
MAPYRIFVYEDAKGRPSVRAIDLSARPDLGERIPGLTDYEIKHYLPLL